MTQGVPVSTENPYSAVVSQNQTYTAFFERNAYTLQTIAAEGSTIIVTDLNGNEVPSGSTVLHADKLIVSTDTLNCYVMESVMLNGTAYIPGDTLTITENIILTTMTEPVITFVEVKDTVCQGYAYEGYGFTIDADSTSLPGLIERTVTVPSVQTGCDSITNLQLVVNPMMAELVEATACNSYTWNGTTYTQSGDYPLTLTAANGCDSVVTLQLTLNYSEMAEFVETACDGYIWNDSVYTQSGDYVRTFTNVNGCDSVVTLHLTINPTQASEFTVTTEDSCYIWNDQIYCMSGDYAQALQTIHGCDSIVTLHLTITVGIDGHDLGAALMLYPNPTTGLLNVRCTGCNELLASVDIQVFDAYGKILQTVPMTSEATQLDLSHYADGIYFVKAVKDGQAFAVRKVVKN